jgi:hypothetical protein
MTDLVAAQKAGKSVSHILMNRWPSDPALQESAEHTEAKFITALKEMGISAGYSRIMPGPLEQASSLDPDYADRQQANLQKIIATLGLPRSSL